MKNSSQFTNDKKKKAIKNCIQKFFHEISFNTVKISNLVGLLLVQVSH